MLGFGHRRGTGYGFADGSILTHGCGLGVVVGVEDWELDLGGGAPIGTLPGGGFHGGGKGGCVEDEGATGGGIGIGVIGVIGIGVIGVTVEDEADEDANSLLLKIMLCSLEHPVLGRF